MNEDWRERDLISTAMEDRVPYSEHSPCRAALHNMNASDDNEITNVLGWNQEPHWPKWPMSLSFCLIFFSGLYLYSHLHFIESLTYPRFPINISMMNKPLYAWQQCALFSQSSMKCFPSYSTIDSHVHSWFNLYFQWMSLNSVWWLVLYKS